MFLLDEFLNHTDGANIAVLTITITALLVLHIATEK